MTYILIYIPVTKHWNMYKLEFEMDNNSLLM